MLYIHSPVMAIFPYISTETMTNFPGTSLFFEKIDWVSFGNMSIPNIEGFCIFCILKISPPQMPKRCFQATVIQSDNTWNLTALAR